MREWVGSRIYLIGGSQKSNNRFRPMICIAQETNQKKKKKLKELIKEPTMKFSSSFLVLSETQLGV